MSKLTNDPIPRKQPNRQQGERTGWPYFIEPFWLPLGIQQVKLLHAGLLKVRDIEYNVDLTKNYCCSQHAKIQLNSYTHSLDTADFRVSWTKFLHPPLTMHTQKPVKQLLAFLNLHQHAKYLFNSLTHSWDTVNFRKPWPDYPPQFLTMSTQKNLSTFNLCKLVSTCKKLGYFIDLLWRYGWLKIFCNLIGWEYFGPYIKNKNFPKYGIYAGMQKILEVFIIEQSQ